MQKSALTNLKNQSKVSYSKNKKNSSFLYKEIHKK